MMDPDLNQQWRANDEARRKSPPAPSPPDAFDVAVMHLAACRTEVLRVESREAMASEAYYRTRADLAHARKVLEEARAKVLALVPSTLPAPTSAECPDCKGLGYIDDPHPGEFIHGHAPCVRCGVTGTISLASPEKS